MAELFGSSDTFIIYNYSVQGLSYSISESIHFNDAKETNIARTLPANINLYIRPRTQYQTVHADIPSIGNIQNVASGLTIESVSKYGLSYNAVGADMYEKTYNNDTYYLRNIEKNRWIAFHTYVTYLFHRGMSQPYKWDPLNTNFPSTLPNAYTLRINEYLSVQMIGEPMCYTAVSFAYIRDFFKAGVFIESLKSLIYYYLPIYYAQNVAAIESNPGENTQCVAAYSGFGYNCQTTRNIYGVKTGNLPLRSIMSPYLSRDRFIMKHGDHMMTADLHPAYPQSGTTRYNHAESGRFNGATNERSLVVELLGRTFRNQDIFPEDYRIFCGMSGKASWNPGGYHGNPLDYPSINPLPYATFPSIVLTANRYIFDETLALQMAASLYPFKAVNAQGESGLIITNSENIGLIESPYWMPLAVTEKDDEKPAIPDIESKTITMMPWNKNIAYIPKVGGYAIKNMLYCPTNFSSENKYLLEGLHEYKNLGKTTGDGGALFAPSNLGNVDTEWYYTDWMNSKSKTGSRIKTDPYMNGVNVNLEKIEESNYILHWASGDQSMREFNTPIPDLDISQIKLSPFYPGKTLKKYWNENKKSVDTPLPVVGITPFVLGDGKTVDKITAMTPDNQVEDVTGKIGMNYGVNFDNYRTYGNNAKINVRPFYINEYNEEIYENLSISSITIINETGKIYKTLEFSMNENIYSFEFPTESISRYSKRYLNFLISDATNDSLAIIRYPFIKDSMNISNIENTSIVKVLT